MNKKACGCATYWREKEKKEEAAKREKRGHLEKKKATKRDRAVCGEENRKEVHVVAFERDN